MALFACWASAIYVTHWVLAWISTEAFLNTNNNDSIARHCLGRLTSAGGCQPRWGPYSLAIYAPELVFFASLLVAAGARRITFVKYGLASASLGLAVFMGVLWATSFWALGQMPVVIPSLPL